MSSTLSESTPNERLRTVLEHALGYEEAMERSLARGPGYAPYPFLPAAQVAYSHMLAILAKPALTSADREQRRVLRLDHEDPISPSYQAEANEFRGRVYWTV